VENHFLTKSNFRKNKCHYYTTEIETLSMSLFLRRNYVGDVSTCRLEPLTFDLVWAVVLSLVLSAGGATVLPRVSLHHSRGISLLGYFKVVAQSPRLLTCPRHSADDWLIMLTAVLRIPQPTRRTSANSTSIVPVRKHTFNK